MTKTLVARKWRPTLGMVVFIVLTTVMALPLVGLFFFRLYENQLVHQTEAELIGQTAALAAIFSREAEAALPPGPPPQSRPAAVSSSRSAEPYHPIEPSLDLAADDILGRRPDARTAAAPADPAIQRIGADVYAIAKQMQDVTLAGFRILDRNGVIIGGRDEIGLSLAHVEEVATALRGHYRSVLRVRVSDTPPPPLYSISRGTGVRVFVAMPVMVRGEVAGVIYASRTPSNIVKHLFGERRKVILAGLTVLATTLVIGLVFSRTITRPIQGLISQTRDIGQNGREAIQPLHHHGTREIAMLSQSFLDMANRLSERSDYITTFAAHVSHELKSPLTSIQGAAELLRDSLGPGQSGMSDEQHRRFLDNIISDSQRLTVLLTRLRELARADNPQKSGTARLDAVLKQVQAAFPELAIRVGDGCEAAIGIAFDNAVIVFSHLADNAKQHKAKEVRVQAIRKDASVAITVSDDGEGISESNRHRIFEAFFTTRRETGGTGMGLRIVQSMLHSHDGEIAVLRSERGAAFEVTLPAA